MSLRLAPEPSIAIKPDPKSAGFSVSPTFIATLTALTIWGLGQALLLALRPGHFFPPLDLIDSWVYASFKWDAPRQFAEFGPTYYGSRIPVFALGAACHALFPPLVANVVEKLLWSGAIAWAVASIASASGRPLAAGLAAGAVTFAPPLILSLHGEYVDVPVICWGAIALALVLRARDAAQPGRFWFAAGFCLACLALSNLAALFLQGLGILASALVWHRASWKTQAHFGGAVLAGGVTALGTAGLISWALGGPLFVLAPQLRAVFQLAALGTNPWAPSSWAWWSEAFWLVLPLAALLWGGLVLRCRSSAPGDSTTALVRALTTGLAVSLGGALVLEFAGQGVLYHHFYASMHLALALPLLTACALAKSPLSPRAKFAVLVSLALLGAAVLSGRWPAIVLGVQRDLGLALPSALLLGSLALLCVAAAIWTERRRDGASAVVGPFALAGVLLASMPLGFHAPPTSDRLRERYMAVRESFARLNQILPLDGYRLWIDFTHPDERSLAATKLWDYRLLTRAPWPSLPEDAAVPPLVVVPAKRGSVAERGHLARQLLTSRSTPTIIEQIENTASSVDGFDLLVLSVKDTPVDPESSTAVATSVVQELKIDPQSDAMPWESHTYSIPPRGILGRRAGEVLFTPGTPRDHVASPFAALPTGIRELIVAIELPSPGRAQLFVQDRGFATLATVPLDRAGRTLHRVRVPPTSSEVRVCLTTDAPAAMPTRVTVHAVLPATADEK